MEKKMEKCPYAIQVIQVYCCKQPYGECIHQEETGTIDHEGEGALHVCGVKGLGKLEKKATEN